MATDPFIVFAPDVPEVEGHYPPPFDKERVGLLSQPREGDRQRRASASGSIGSRPASDRASRMLTRTRRSSSTCSRASAPVRLIEPGTEPREVPLRAGHVVSFVAGTRIAHCFVNRSTADCQLFTVGERKPAIERAFYAEDKEYDVFYARERPSCYWAKDE